MVAVITGASGGIGKETAKILVSKGWEVICLQRRDCEVEGTQSIKCDITNQQDIDRAFSMIDKIDLLINNAGFGVSGCVEFTDMNEIRSQFELNFFAHIAVTKAALAKLRESKGRVIFISSAASVFQFRFSLSIPQQNRRQNPFRSRFQMSLNNSACRFALCVWAMLKQDLPLLEKRILRAMMFTAVQLPAVWQLWKMTR